MCQKKHKRIISSISMNQAVFLNPTGMVNGEWFRSLQGKLERFSVFTECPHVLT